MSEFKEYKRKNVSEMRPYVKDEDMKGISVSKEDTAAGSPKEGDMIARNPKNHKDLWLVAKAYFEDNLEEVSSEEAPETPVKIEVKETTPFQRVEAERDALKDKMAKIKNAVKKGLVPGEAEPLLNAQLIHMKYYADILTTRIKEWKN